MDIIPVSLGPFCYINAADGVILADARLRSYLAQGFPDLWVKAQDIADLVESCWRFWLTFHIHLLIFRREFDPDIGPGTFDLETR